MNRFIQFIKSAGFFKEASGYLVFATLNKAIPFLLLPFITKYLSPEEFGVYALYVALSNILRPLVTFNVHGAVNRAYYDQESIRFGRYVFSSLFIMIIALSVLSILILGQGMLFGSIFGYSLKLIAAALAAAFAFGLDNVFLAIVRAEKRVKIYGYYVVSRTILIFGVTVILLFFGYGYWVWILSQVIFYFIFSLFGAYWLLREGFIEFKVVREYIVDILKFTLPLIPHSIGSVAFNFSGRIFVEKMVGAEELGIYSVAYQIAGVMAIIGVALQSAWIPWQFENLKKATIAAKENIVKITYICYAGLLVITIIACLMYPFICSVFLDQEYQGSTVYFSFLVFSFCIQAMYFMMSGYIYYMKKTILISYSTISIGILSLALNYFLIQAYGGIGVAISTLISWSLLFIITFWQSYKVLPMPWLYPIRRYV